MGSNPAQQQKCTQREIERERENFHCKLFHLCCSIHPRPLVQANAVIPNYCGPYPHCRLDKAVACTQHMETSTVVLVEAKGQDNAQGPSNEHLWAPLGEEPKCPSAHKRDMFTLNPSLISLQQNRDQIKLRPRSIHVSQFLLGERGVLVEPTPIPTAEGLRGAGSVAVASAPKIAKTQPMIANYELRFGARASTCGAAVAAYLPYAHVVLTLSQRQGGVTTGPTSGE